MLNKIGIQTTKKEYEQKTKELAHALNLPLLDSQAENYEFILQVGETGLALIQPCKQTLNPIQIDFVNGKANHRRRFGGGKNQAIAKAVGFKRSFPPSILDTTAGLGQDAFVLASLGCKVTLIERSPILFALLHDALERAEKESDLSDIISSMYLIQTDSIQFMKNLTEKENPDVIYLDPMFPERKKSARVKKEMEALQDFFEYDEKEDTLLLATALQYTKNRVVVKRPRLAPCIEGKPPHFQIMGKSCRFDIYQKN